MYYDHYTGFEGEAEITFASEDGCETVDLWNGYLFSIMENITPNTAGMWESLALLYHTRTGWYSTSPFKLEEVKEALSQLKLAVSNDWHSVTRSAYGDLLKVFEYSIKNKQTVIISYS